MPHLWYCCYYGNTTSMTMPYLWHCCHKIDRYILTEIAIHNIAIRPFKVPETSPNYDFHVLTCIIGWNHFFMLFLFWCVKATFCLFTLPSLHRILITLTY